MGAWQEQIEQHPIWETLKNIEARLSATEDFPSNPDQAELYLRVLRLVEESRRRLAAVDTLFLAPAQLNAPQKHGAQLLAALEAYTLEAPQQLDSANSHATNLFSTVHTQVHATVTPDDAVATGEALSALRRSIGQQKRRMKVELDEFTAEVKVANSHATAIKAELDTQKERADKFVQETKTQLDAAESQRSSSLQTAITDSNDRVEAKLKEFGERSESALTATKTDQGAKLAALQKEMTERAAEWEANKRTREAEWDATKKTREDDFEEMKTAWTKLSHDARAEAEKAAGEVIVSLKAKKQEAEKIVGIVAMTGMSAGYEQIANNQGDAAKFWSGLTVASLVGLITFMVITFFSAGDTFSWLSLARRVSIAGAAVLLAGYSAQQAARNRTLEARNRRYQLELASLDPFLASLEESERNKVKTELAGRLFGVPDPDASQLQTVSATNLLDITRDVIKKIK